jgi:hypothetical protein
MQMKNSDRIVNLKGIALSIFAVIVGISLNILFTLKFNETHIGIRVAATDVLIPFILFLLLMQVIKKKELPVLITPFGYRLLAVMSLWLSICLVNGYLSSGVLTNWAFLNKYIGWFVLMSYFAAGLYISEQNLQIKKFFFRSLFVATWLVCISEIIIHWFYIVGFFHQYHYIARHERMEGLYQNPNAFGIFLAVMFVLHIQAMRDGSRVFNKWIIAFGSSVVLLCLYYSYSRSAWLGAVLGLIVAIIIDKKLFARVVIVSCIALMGNYLAFSDQTKDYNAKIIKYFYYDVAKVVGGAAGLIQYFEKQKVEGLTNLAAATGDVDITGVLDSDGATTINGITVSGVGDAVEVTTDTGDITFNPSWYLKQNPDVAASGQDPYRHYLMYGAAEGRLPKPESLSENVDTTASGAAGNVILDASAGAITDNSGVITLNEYLIEALSKSPKIFPKEFYDQIILSCNEENTVINRTSNSKNITTTMMIKNNSKHSILLTPGVHLFQVRPRLWNETRTKVLKDGIRTALASPDNKHFIPAGETFKERFSFDVEKIKNFPKSAKYLIFEVVHEGVRWLPRSNKCSFEIVNDGDLLLQAMTGIGEPGTGNQIAYEQTAKIPRGIKSKPGKSSLNKIEPAEMGGIEIVQKKGQRYRSVSSRLKDEGMSVRVKIFKRSISYWLESPFVGIGLGTHLWKSNLEGGLSSGDLVIHNSLNWLLVETGLIGVIIFCSFIFSCLKNQFKREPEDKELISSKVLISIVFVMIGASMATEVIYQRYFWLLLGLFLVKSNNLLVKNTERILS